MGNRGLNTYTISQVVAVRETPNHIPYIAYAIISGPRGGRLLVDYYNLERIILNRIRDSRVCRIDPIIQDIAREQGRLRFVERCDTSDLGLKGLANSMGIRPVIRNSGRFEYKRLFDKLDITSIENYIARRNNW